MAETSAGSSLHSSHASWFSSPGLWILGEAPSCSCCLQLGSELVANGEFSTPLPSHGQSATQQEPEIFRLYAGILMETFAPKLEAMLLYPAAWHWTVCQRKAGEILPFPKHTQQEKINVLIRERNYQGRLQFWQCVRTKALLSKLKTENEVSDSSIS